MELCAGPDHRARPGLRRSRVARTTAGSAASGLGSALAAALVAGLLTVLVIGVAAPAHADTGDVVVAKRDPKGDVEVLAKRGPGKNARASIDLRSFTLTEESDGVRMDIRLQRILTNSRFDQVVEVQMKPADSTQTWFLDVSMSGQGSTTATATYTPDLSGEGTQICSPLETTVDPDSDTLSLVVLDRCLPTDAAKIRVYSSLVKPDGVGGYALDKLPVRGGQLIQP